MKPETVLEAAKRKDLESVNRHFEQEDFADHVANEIALIAADNNDLDLLRYVSSKNPSIVKKEGDPDYDVLRRAVSSGALDVVKYLVEEHDADILHESTSDPYKNCDCPTALHVAMKKGHFNILKYFLEDRNIDINTASERKGHSGVQTILFFAVKCGMEDHILRYLVEDRNASLTMKNWQREHVLYEAARQNNLEFIKYALDERKAKININGRNRYGGTLVQVLACSTRYSWDPKPVNKIPLLKYLVDEKKADVNIADDEGDTPLHCARSNETCTFLVKRGAPVNQKNKSGGTPLHESIFRSSGNESFGWLKCLVEHGADIHSKIVRAGNRTPLLLATSSSMTDDDDPCGVRKCQLLIQHGADINLADNYGDTPLRYSVLGLSPRGGSIPATRLELFHYYLEHGADVNRGNKDGDTPLHWAARYSTRDVCQQLVDHGADINQSNNKGETAVYGAVVFRQIKVLEYLVGEKHADVNILTLEDKMSPLHFAASVNDYDLCRYLVENGAQTQVLDKDGRTPVQGASDKRVIHYLQKMSAKRDRRHVAVPWAGMPSLSMPYALDAIPAKASVGTNRPIEGPSSTFVGNSAHLSNFPGFLALLNLFTTRPETSLSQNRKPFSFQMDSLPCTMESFLDDIINRLRNDNVI